MALNAGDLTHELVVENPTTTPDGDGAFTQTWAPIGGGQVWASIEKASAQMLERRVPSGVMSQCTHVITMRWHPDVSNLSRVSWLDRAGRRHYASVTDNNDENEEGHTLILAVVEIVP